MPSDDALAAGFALMATAWTNQPMSQERMDLFAQVCKDMTDREWATAIEKALKSEREFAPPPGVILNLGLPSVGPSVRAEALHEAIMSVFEGGQRLGPRDVRERWGVAAEAAFIVAGGTRAFEWCQPDGLPFRRKAFVATFCEAVNNETLIESEARAKQISNAVAKEILGDV